MKGIGTGAKVMFVPVLTGLGAVIAYAVVTRAGTVCGAGFSILWFTGVVAVVRGRPRLVPLLDCPLLPGDGGQAGWHIFVNAFWQCQIPCAAFDGIRPWRSVMLTQLAVGAVAGLLTLFVLVAMEGKEIDKPREPQHE